MLKKNTINTSSQFSENETLKLLHELEVHQIELEMQNEELLVAKEKAEVASQKYAELYDFAPSGYFTLSKEGIIIDLNLTGSQMLGKELLKLRTSLFGFFVANDSKPIFNRFLRDIFSNKVKEYCEITMSLDSRLPLFVYLTGIITGNGAQCIVTMIDITKRKLVEKALYQLNEELEDRVKERTSELLESNIALRQAEEKYRTVADYTYGWEFWIDQNDNILYCSPSCERITGYKSEEFLQDPGLLLRIVHPDDLTGFHCHKHMEEMAKEGNHEIQYRIVRMDGSIRWIDHVCQPIFNNSGIFIGTRGSNRDITGRKKMEQLLKTNTQKYKLLSENITDGIFICREGNFEYVNKAMSRIFGYDDHEMDGVKLTSLVTPEYYEELDKFLGQNAPINEIRNIEAECLKKDHTIIDVEILLNYIGNEHLIYGVVHDITEKRQIQKNIVKAIMQTEEKERAYFSKELHDGLGPLLSTIKLYLQWSVRPKSNKSRDEIIHKAEDILEEALETVKEISNKLSPHLLTYYGLTSALQSFVDKFEKTSAIKIVFESNSHRRFEIEVEAALYRALIECINNTIKHAKASNIYIKLYDTGSQLQLQYRDDGAGFDMVETLTVQKGLGLFNLQNRIQTIGGKITMLSKPGNGVDYQIVVNL